MAMIRRTSPEELDKKFVTLNSSPEEITAAVDHAILRYLSLIKNKKSAFGKLLLLTKDPSIKYPIIELDIIKYTSARATFVDGISSFMKIELSSKMRGLLRQQKTAEVLQMVLNTLATYSKFDIEITSVVKVDNNICINLGSKSAAKQILIRVTKDSVLIETGLIKRDKQLKDAQIEGALL